MPRGVGYGYEHYMLLDVGETFNYKFISHNVLCKYRDEDDSHLWEDDDLTFCPECENSVDYEWDDYVFADWKNEVAESFKADLGERSSSEFGVYTRDSYIFAENDRLAIGLDHGGDMSALFVVPKTWEKPVAGGYYDDVQYNIERDVKRGFKKLIKNRPGLYYRTCWDMPSSQGYTMARQAVA